MLKAEFRLPLSRNSARKRREMSHQGTDVGNLVISGYRACDSRLRSSESLS